MLPLISRRRFLSVMRDGLVTVYLGCSACSSYNPWSSFRRTRPELDKLSPIDRSLPFKMPEEYSGDNPEIPHSILWTKSGPLPLDDLSVEQIENVPLVIIGGGISGLSTAYLLRDLHPVILEQAPRFGGNSKGQSFNGLDYSIGAAYFIQTEADSQIGKLFSELGIDDFTRYSEGESIIELNSNLQKDFWNNTQIPSNKSELRQQNVLRDYFLSIYNEEAHSYPDIPYPEAEIKQIVANLDQLSFKEHLEKMLGASLQPRIQTLLEHYCWSSLGGSASEISAAAGLNFYCAEYGALGVCPGGNSAIAERILHKLSEEVPLENLRTSSLVTDVQVKDAGTYVTYRSATGENKTIRANAVVMACPKFITKRILANLEEDRLAAINQLTYRAYLVANLVLNVSNKKDWYDLYLLGAGKGYHDALNVSSAKQGATDVILANFACHSDNHTVLTLYRALPFDTGRAELYDPNSYTRFKNEFENQIAKSILPMLGFNTSQVIDLRLTRWGHPLPLAKTGLFNSGIPEKLRKPFRDRVFFVEQDNWALPAIETALTEAITQAPEIRKALS